MDAIPTTCPYCGAPGEVVVDPTGGHRQSYVEDCEVCCNPWSVRVIVEADQPPAVLVSTLDDA